MAGPVKPVPPGQLRSIRAMRRRGASLREISAATGWSISAAGRICADMKTDARAAANRKRAAIEPEWLDLAKRMRADGHSRNHIAAAIDIPKSVVYRRLK